MSIESKIFAYCERGTDPSFFAEPINAITNVAFVVAGIVILFKALGTSSVDGRVMPILFAVLITLIGIGSFLFHTFATPWAAAADVIPIGLFMLTYFAYALRVWLRLPILPTIALTLGFVAALHAARFVTCGPDGLVQFGGDGGPCFNGSIGYFPALIAMAAVGGLLAMRRHPAGVSLLVAAAIFAVSLTFRTLDREFCAETLVAHHHVGTHFLWHLLNAVTLFVATRPALRTLRSTEAEPKGSSPRSQKVHSDP